MTKATELREMSDEQIRLVWKDAAESLFRLRIQSTRSSTCIHGCRDLTTACVHTTKFSVLATTVYTSRQYIEYSTVDQFYAH